MNKFFISLSNTKKIIVLSFCIFLVFPFKYLLLWLVLLVAFFLVFKKNKVLLKDSLSNTIDILVSPLTGEVISVESNDKETKYFLKVSCFKNFGLYFPFSAVIGKIKNNQSKRIKGVYQKELATRDFRHTEVEFKNKLDVSVKIFIYHCMNNVKPHIWLKTGDKGRVSSNLGFMPFGGVVEIVTNNKCDQLVEVGDKVFAGSTPLAGFKG
jgi:hypothetical protein